MSSDFPDNLKYNKDYSWVKVDKDTATIGIIAPSAKKVKEFVFISLPDKGKNIKKGETYVSLESVKWSGHLSSPVTGKIIEVNDALFDEPSKLNEKPYENWIVKIQISKPEELKDLIDSKQAEKLVKK